MASKNMRKLKRKMDNEWPVTFKEQPINMVRLLKPKGYKDDLLVLRGPWFKPNKKGVK